MDATVMGTPAPQTVWDETVGGVRILYAESAVARGADGRRVPAVIPVSSRVILAHPSLRQAILWHLLGDLYRASRN